MYDFSRCKLCGRDAAEPKYKLKKMTLYACSECDFHYIDAMDEYPQDQPEPQLTVKAREYIEKQLPQNGAQLRKDLEFVKSHVDLMDKACLDIGSGAGLFPSLLKESGAQVEGIEPQQIFREFASKRFELSLRRELIDDPYWQDGFQGFFDVVTLWDTLEHVNFPADTLKAACAVMKPGGCLFLDTPSRDSFFYKASEWSYRFSGGAKPALLNKLYSPKPYRHKQIFTEAQLNNLLEQAGFSEIERSPLHRSKNKLVVVCPKSA